MTITGRVLTQMLASAASALTNEKEAINQLNVFPVPDGDTGINMAMTMTPARTLPQTDASVGKVMGDAAGAMLRSARGNSGAILSLFFRGMGKAMKDREEADVALLSRAFADGTAEAYRAVMSPAEGTILTVMRVCSEEAAASATRYRQDAVGFFRYLLEVAERTLARTPEMLPVLRQAHVVDAGGAGFVCVLRGMYAALSGTPVTSDEAVEGPADSHTGADFSSFDTEDIRFAYCTECIVDKSEAYLGEGKADAFRETITSWGDSMVFVEDDTIIKLHIHTNDPGAVLSQAILYGTLFKVKVENMRNQHTQLTSPVPRKKYGFVSVCVGEGISSTFRDLGCDRIVSGGQSMNPSTEDILAAINQTESDCVFVLPNNKNIFLVAKEAAAMTDNKQVIVLESHSVPEGIGAILAFDPDATVTANTDAMREAMEHVTGFSITHAARDAEIEGFSIRKGQYMGLMKGKILAACDTLEECADTLGRQMKTAAFITIFAGQDATEEQAETVRALLQELAPQSEVAVTSGGQPLYDFLISAE